MIGKITSGRSFGGCVRYVIEKDTARVLDGIGVRISDAKKMVADFNFQRVANPALSKAVGHISLNFSEQDKHKLTDKKMLEMAREYLERIGIRDTQVLFVRHEDKSHPHVHLVYNRVSNSGKTISDKNLFHRNAAVCKVMTKTHGLFLASGKEHVQRQALKGADKVKYQIFDRINYAKGLAVNWKSFEQALKKDGVNLIFKYNGNTNMIQGVSFGKDSYVFKGSEIDRSLSYGKLNSLFETADLDKSYTSDNIQEHSIMQTLVNEFRGDLHSRHTGESMLDVLLQSGFPNISEEPEPYPKRKKKSQSKNKGPGISR